MARLVLQRIPSAGRGGAESLASSTRSVFAASAPRPTVARAWLEPASTSATSRSSRALALIPSCDLGHVLVRRDGRGGSNNSHADGTLNLPGRAARRSCPTWSVYSAGRQRVTKALGLEAAAVGRRRGDQGRRTASAPRSSTSTPLTKLIGSRLGGDVDGAGPASGVRRLRRGDVRLHQRTRAPSTIIEISFVGLGRAREPRPSRSRTEVGLARYPELGMWPDRSATGRLFLKPLVAPDDRRILVLAVLGHCCD